MIQAVPYFLVAAFGWGAFTSAFYKLPTKNPHTMATDEKATACVEKVKTMQKARGAASATQTSGQKMELLSDQDKVTFPGLAKKEAMGAFFAEEPKMRDDVIVIERVGAGTGEARGTNIFASSGQAVISLEEGLCNEDSDVAGFIIKRQAYHIRNNTKFFTPLIGAISALALAIIGTLVIPYAIVSVIVVGLVGLAAVTALGRIWESKADAYAIEKATDDELLAGWRLLKAKQAWNIEKRQKSKLAQLFISPEGDERFALAHPFISHRIKKIEAALEAKNISFQGYGQNINKLKELLKDGARKAKGEPVTGEGM